MKSTGIISTTDAPAAAMFDRCLVGRILRRDAGIQWPEGVVPRNIHIQRGWPMRNGGFSVEWSFQLGREARYSLYGTSQTDLAQADGVESRIPAIEASGIRGVRVSVPQWGVRIHSPDRDSELPLLAKCLNGTDMAEQLDAFWKPQNVRACVRKKRVECRLLSYRAGRRAAISFRIIGADGSSKRLIGKTYNDGRGERLVLRHNELDRRLALSTNGRARVPKVEGYLPDLRLALFSWVESEESVSHAASPGVLSAHAKLAAEALAALHVQEVDGLPSFTAGKERAIIDRWYAMLNTVDIPSADATRSLAAALGARADAMSSGRTCMLHRDFYEGQFMYDGRTITILDLDTLAVGDPCVDVGNLLAHMYFRSLRSPAPAHEFTCAARHMLNTYAQRLAGNAKAVRWRSTKGPLLHADGLTFYWASALFRVGAVHALRTSTGCYAASLWQFAEQLLIAQAGGQRARRLAVGDRAVIPDPQCIMGELSS